MADNELINISNISGANKMGVQQVGGNATAEDLRSINKIYERFLVTFTMLYLIL